MTKRDILLQACRELGDTSTRFVEDKAAPTLDFILLDLAHNDSIAALRRYRTFVTEAGRTVYDTRELSQLTPHYPSAILSLTVFAWGIAGQICKVSHERIRALRLQDGEEAEGRWKAWSADRNPLELQVWPPVGADDAGVDCEVEFESLPSDLPLDDDLVEFDKRAVNVLVYGVKWRLAGYKAEWSQAVVENLPLYTAGKKWMWGERHNKGVQQVERDPGAP